MKTMKSGLCMVMVLALTMCPVLGAAEVASVDLGEPEQQVTHYQEPETVYQEAQVTIGDNGTPLAAGSYSNPIDTPEQSGGTITYPDGTPVPEEIPGMIDETETAIVPNPVDETNGNPSQPSADQHVEEQPGEEQQPAPTYNTDLAQFVPGTDYGLFGMRDEVLVNLNGATLALDKNYTLAVRFLINKPVVANEVYSYWLPAVLAGKSGAAEQVFSCSAGAIAKCYVNGNEVRVVFTELAQELTKDGGNAFLLLYSFKETLNETVAGDYTSFRIQMPMEHGSEIIELNIEQPKTEEPKAETLPTAQPEVPETAEIVSDEPEVPAMEKEQPDVIEDNTSIEEAQPEVTEETVAEDAAEEEQPADDRELICGLEESDEHTHTEECYLAEEETEEVLEDEQVAVERSITLERNLPEIILEGETFAVKANLVGFENDVYTLRWQYNAGEGWIDYESGNGLSEIVVASDGANVNYDWQVLVNVTAPAEEAARPDASAAAADAGQPDVAEQPTEQIEA